MYKTRLNLVEPTKLLERVTVDNLRFLNSIGHDYINGAYFISPELYKEEREYIFAKYLTSDKSSETNIRNEVYKVMHSTHSQFPIYGFIWQFDDTFLISSLPTTISLTAPDGEKVFSTTISKMQPSVIEHVKLETVGTYTLTYTASDRTNPDRLHIATYKIAVISNTVAKKPYTITEVIERILNAGVGTWNGYYKLDPKLAEKWKNIQAPEFEITGKTLFEALLMVGGYKDVQAIPRLGPTPGSEEDWEYNFITFDLLNEGKDWIPPSGCISRQTYYDGESYCGAVESYVDNFVDKTENGAVRPTFPMTVRTETSDLVIDDGHAIIKTDFSIYSIQKVDQAHINKTGGPVGDITPYIFEKSEYDNLTSYKGQFPNAKQFAFYYIQGQPNLYGLVLKPETATPVGAAIEDFAAVQIAEKKSGQNYDKQYGVAAFAYRVTYTPITNRRLRQFKPVVGFPSSNMLYYNQSANIVDSKNYGGRMKGELARIGNKVELETYRLYKLADMPKAGMKKDGKFISQVDWEMDLTSIKVTIHLVKNYNRLSEYVGINSMQRFYEVSERQATERQCNFSYISQIGKIVNSSAKTKRIVTKTGIEMFANSFKNNEVGPNNFKISYAVVTAYDADGKQIESPTLHSVCGNGVGNSMSFYFSFADNYSAGDQALYKESAKKLQRAVAYGDAYGQLYKLKMEFYGNYVSQAQPKTYLDQLPVEAGGTGFCDALPEYKETLGFEPLISYETVIDKNSGEKITVETQIHFQANEENVIIGASLGEDNLLVSGETHNIMFVCLPYEIEFLQERIPVEDIEKYKVNKAEIIVASSTGVQIGRIRNTTDVDALCWACVNEHGNILIAKNVNIKQGEFYNNLTQINFNLTIE